MDTYEFELPDIGWRSLALGMAVAVVLLAFLGALVTPTEPRPELLTPVRRQARILARQARLETESLAADAAELRTLLEQERPDPVAAMLLAERVYAHHSQGTSATGGARQALIAAAEATARYATGELSLQTAAETFNGATALIETLAAAPKQGETASPAVSATGASTAPLRTEQVFLPRIQIPGARPSAPGRRLLVTTLPEP